MLSGLKLSARFVFGIAIFWVLVQTIPDSYLSAQTSRDRVVLEVTILRATPELAKTTFPAGHDLSLTNNGSEEITTDTPAIKDNAVTATTTVEHKEQVRPHSVSVQEYQRILNIIENANGCSVTAGPATTIFGDGTVTGFTGTAETYCVSAEERRAKFGTVVNVPVYQVVEDGIIVEHQAKVSANQLVDLNSKIVINEIVNLETFTFAGVMKPITLHLPTIKTRLLNINATLGQDQVLIIPSKFVNNTVEQKSGRFLSNVPYVSRLFKNGISRETCALYYVISIAR